MEFFGGIKLVILNGTTGIFPQLFCFQGGTDGRGTVFWRRRGVSLMTKAQLVETKTALELSKSDLGVPKTALVLRGSRAFSRSPRLPLPVVRVW